MLDPKGLEAAAQAMMPHDPGPQIVEIVRKDAEKAITAYLSAITPAEAGGLVDAQTEARAIAEQQLDYGQVAAAHQIIIRAVRAYEGGGDGQ